MRTLLVATAVAALAAAVPGQPFPPGTVVINEFVYDDSSTDDREFVELYNTGAVTVPLDGWVLEGADEAYPTDNNADYTIPLGMGFQIPPGGYFVIGSSNLSPAPDLPVGAANLWENGASCPESLVLKDATGQIQDALTYEANKTLSTNAACTVYPPIDPTVAVPGPFIEGTGLWGNYRSVDGTVQSLSRWVDGLDTDDNGWDFGLLPATPGLPNGSLNTVPLPWSENFDTLAVNSDVAGWTGSFVNPRVIDPTVPTVMPPLNNPNAIPASPTGGNAMVMWDPLGGGNCALIDTPPGNDFVFEAFVYFSTSAFDPNLLNTDFETWSIGARGTTDSFHNHPCPGQQCTNVNNLVLEANGNTGVAWVYMNSAAGGELWLVEEGPGNDTERVLGQVQVMPGMNDGWQRLRLEVAGDVVQGNFGGTLGNPNDGTKFQELLTADSVGRIGGVYLGYREFFITNANTRPLTLDEVTVNIGSAPFSVFLSQPTGPGSLQLDSRGLNPGVETWHVFSLELCPGGPGTGPFAGLCFTSTANLSFLNFQLTAPTPTPPFKVLPTGSSFTFGPLAGIGPGLTLEVLAADFLPGQILNRLSCIDSITTQ